MFYFAGCMASVQIRDTSNEEWLTERLLIYTEWIFLSSSMSLTANTSLFALILEG